METETFETEPVAVVGLGCWYPGASSPLQLWENILARRRQFRRMPDERLPLSEYHDADPAAADRTYGKWAAVLDGYEFDWAARRIPKSTYESTDIAHWLALDTALQMLEDAGYDAKRLPGPTTQVIVGNTLTGEFTRSNTLRMRWPFVRKTLRAAASRCNLPDLQLTEIEEDLEQCFKSVFAPVTEDTLAGGLANTIAGRIANYLNLNGGCYVVDGACSSSLIAVYNGAMSLAAGHADFVIAGGVDISLDPFELIGFAKTGALAPNHMRVYDSRGNGFIPGEGCGFVGLKRLREAERDGDKIYAIVDGWGMSSDGRGGITAPSVNGQSIALERAYRSVDLRKAPPDFIEGHGTGTTVGDKVELAAIGNVIGKDSAQRRCGVTSFKSIVGHTKAAAGVGAFIKAVIATNQRILPPTAGCELPNDVFDSEAQGIYPLLRGEIRSATASMRSGVSAMGFGGINVHVTLVAPDSPPDPALNPTIEVRSALASAQDSELFVIADSTLEGLRAQLARLEAEAGRASLAELADLAAALCRSLGSEPPQNLRAAVVASTQEELADRLARLRARLELATSAHGARWLDPEHRVALGRGAGLRRSEIGLVFPGQGSQQLAMARALVERFGWARELAQNAGQWAAEAGTPGVLDAMFPDMNRYPYRTERQSLERELTRTEFAQPAIVLASLLWLQYLRRLGVSADHVLGHSLGELTAFYAAGAFDEKELIQLAAVRGQCMANSVDRAGAMAVLACDLRRAEQLLEQATPHGYAVIANINALDQIVASGERAAIDAVVEMAGRANISARMLPVSNAFHSELMTQASEAFLAKAPIRASAAAMRGRLYSSLTGGLLENAADLREHFAQQILSPVQFVSAAQAMLERCRLLLEVGPGRVLTGLIGRIAKPSEPGRCLPVEGEAERFEDLNWALACAHVHGVAVDWARLHDDRIVRPYSPASERRFIVNPCERPLVQLPPRRAIQPATVAASESGMDIGIGSALEHLQRYLAQRGSFIADVIKADIRDFVPRTGDKRPQPPSSDVAEPAPSVGSPIASAEIRVATPAAPTPTARVVLRRVAAQLTGFDERRIELSMRLIDDLNLDSIKAAALIGRAASELGVAGQIDAAQMMAATLEEIAQRLDELAGPAQTAVAESTPSAEPVLIAAVAQTTGFAAEQLHRDLRLLDDLNLDSIKVGALLGQVAAQLGLAGQIDPAEMAGWSLGEVAARMDALLAKPMALAASSRAAAPASTPPSDRPASSGWVRAFALRLQPEPRQPTGVDERRRFDGKSVVVVHHHEISSRSAVAIEDRLRKLGAHVLRVTAQQLRSSTDRMDDLVVVLPVHDQPSTDDSSELSTVVELLAAVAVETAKRRCANIHFVQFGGQDAVRGAVAPSARIDSCCTRSFAASLHLERPDALIRVLDFETCVSDDFIAEQVCADATLAARYVASFYTAEGQRYVGYAEPVERCTYMERALTWGPDDVVVVTGGGKGITAECALAFARRTRVRTILVGSTSASDAQRSGSEIAQTLQRFQSEELVVQYCECDITDAVAVATLVGRIEADVGPITGLIHGAGLNKPRRAEQVSAAQALEEIGPKLSGILNLCAALDAKPPKLMAGLGSIIGLTGMPGNSWYAFANEALDFVLQRYRSAHPQTAVVTVAYSVWAEVGMGAKLGSTERLAQMGIDAIPKEPGADHFVSCVLQDPRTPQVIVVSRLGALDTWPRKYDAAATPPNYRFIGDVLSHERGVELVCRTRLTPDADPYLRDHSYRGVYLFPTVFGLEAMAQAVAVLTGWSTPSGLSLEDVVLQRPIVVTGDEGAVIELRALALERGRPSEPSRVRVAIRTQETGFTRDHFASTFVFAPPTIADAVPPTWESQLEPIPLLEPRIDLYGGLLFQGEAFQRIEAVYRMSSAGSVSGIRRGVEGSYFGKGLPAALVLGDPSFRDALLQTAQLSEKGQYLPIHIDSWQMRDLGVSLRGVLRAENVITDRPHDELTCDVMAYADGEVVERLSGYRLKRMFLDETAPAPEDWVSPTQRDQMLCEQALDAYCSTFGVTPPALALAFDPQLSTLERSRRRLRELPLFFEALERAAVNRHIPLSDLEVSWNANGKPIVDGLGERLPNVSLSHDRSHCLCVCGEGPQGCDIESIDPRSAEEWRALLSDKRAETHAQLQAMGDDLDTAGTRIWCALESARKALDGADVSLAIASSHQSAVLLHAVGAAGAVSILTFPISLTRPRRKLVAIVVRAADRRPAAARPLAAAGLQTVGEIGVTASRELGVDGQIETRHRFRVPFREATSRGRGVGFPVFAEWMGTIRELGIAHIAERVVPDLASGRWGMVTNESSITVVGDVSCLDLVEGRLWVSRVHGRAASSLDLHFDWVRIGENGPEQRIAYADMTTTWVAITGHGTVELAALPPYLEEFVRSNLPTGSANAAGERRHELPEPLAQLALDSLIYRAPSAPRIEPELARCVFTTSMEESNLVGNIYFSNYYRWQSRTLDRFLFEASGDYFRGERADGDLRCLTTRIQHLREAMPFDEIEVVMALEALYRNGLRLHFDFYRISPRERVKLAHGAADFAWVVTRPDTGQASSEALPQWMREAFFERQMSLQSAG
jgi:enediyne polyketide synthase